MIIIRPIIIIIVVIVIINIINITIIIIKNDYLFDFTNRDKFYKNKK